MRTDIKMSIYTEFPPEMPSKSIWLSACPIFFDIGRKTILEFYRWLVSNNKTGVWRKKILFALLENKDIFYWERIGFPIARRTEWRKNKQILVRKKMTEHKRKLWEDFLIDYRARMLSTP